MICLSSAAFAQIRLGAHRFNENEDTQVRITSNSIINHENYDGIRFANDISVILLPSVAPINDYIKVVPLAAAGAPTYEGEWGLLAGWGPSTDAANIISPALRGVHLNIISNLVCKGIYGDVVQNSNLCTSGTGKL